jgi:transcriptional regulator with XRE-family HTH domain
MRQSDVAIKAGVSQTLVSRAERGRLDELSVRTIDTIAAALGVVLRLEASWHGGQADRLLDRSHAAIVEGVVRTLRELGWLVEVEYTFNHYGERGSVDVLAWHPAERVLLIVEVKSRLTDLQATLSIYARKVRIVPDLVRRGRGWSVTRVARLLVVAGSSTNRRVVADHRATFDSAFPARAPEIRRWLKMPVGGMAGIWFVPQPAAGRSGGTQRVRRRSQ